MLRIKFFLIVFVIIANPLSSQEVSVEFIKNGKEQVLRDDFKIYFINGDSSYIEIVKPRIRNNSFRMPPLNHQEAFILLEHNEDVYSLGKRGVNFEQDMKWIFGFDKKPYSRGYHQDEVNKKDAKGVFYLEIYPLEHGDGVVTRIVFEDLSKYLKYGRSLIYD
jgi:hypothetical protein